MRPMRSGGFFVSPGRARSQLSRFTGMRSRTPRLFVSMHGMSFFDRNVIKRNWSKINESPLTRAGMLVRRIARQSIRHTGHFTPKGKRIKPSRRNKATGVHGPPKSRNAKKPFKLIYSVPVPRQGAVIVGMIGMPNLWSTSAPVPAIHEHGLSVTIRGKGKRRTRRARYPKRAFMQPALVKAAARLPALWSNSIQ